MSDLNPEFGCDFESLEERLAEADCETSASEVQAIICGFLTAGLKADDEEWLQTLISMVNEGRVFVAETMAMIRQVFQWTHFEIQQNDSLTPLLLPDDDYPLIDRMESLAFWCQGFLLGFGLQTGNLVVKNPDVEESLGDLAEISRLELDAEEDEAMLLAFETLVEHAKVAVKVIYWEMVVKTVPATANQSPDNETYH